MCGIAGTTKKASSFEIERAHRSMSMRGPDGPGEFVDDAVTLLHARLSIIDLNVRANQPIHDNDAKVSIVFNGEIYNYAELRKQFSLVYKFKTTSDTEVVLAGYILHGHKIWGMLSGMFAATLYDRNTHKIVLVRDHAGIKPLFYTLQSGVLSWASELKTLFQFDSTKSAINLLNVQRLEEYFVLGYVPSPLTIYDEIFCLEKCSYLEYDIETKKTSLSRYESIHYGNRETLDQIIIKSVTEHLVADVPVSLFFSGGMDSSLLASTLHYLGHETQAFSLHMPGRPLDYEFSQKISTYLGMKTEFALFDQTAFDTSYDKALEYIDVPVADVALFPTHFISALASKNFKVVLSGEGGDELFYGYPRQLVLQQNRKFHLRKLLLGYATLPRHKGKGKLFSKAAKTLDATMYYISQCSPSLTTVGTSELNRIATLLDSTTEKKNLDRDFYLENMLLRKLDMMTMANSIEGRVPLVSPRLFEYVATVQGQKLKNTSDLKRALKNELLKYLPFELVERKKTGFGFRPDSFIASNNQVKEDFHNAYTFLKTKEIPLTRYSENWIFSEKPGLVLACVILYRSIMNHKKL